MAKPTKFNCGIDQDVEVLSQELDDLLNLTKDADVCRHVLRQVKKSIDKLRSRASGTRGSIELVKTLITNGGGSIDEHERCHLRRRLPDENIGGFGCSVLSTGNEKEIALATSTPGKFHYKPLWHAGRWMSEEKQ